MNGTNPLMFTGLEQGGSYGVVSSFRSIVLFCDCSIVDSTHQSTLFYFYQDYCVPLLTDTTVDPTDPFSLPQLSQIGDNGFYYDESWNVGCCAMVAAAHCCVCC